MLEILCIIVFLGALTGMCFFQCSLLMGGITAAAALALFIAGRFVLRAEKFGKFRKCLSLCLSAGLLCLCYFVPVRTGSYGTLDYQKQIGKLVDLQIGGKSDEADEQYELMMKKYGEDDHLLFVKVQSQLDKGNLADAKETLAAFENQHSQLYYKASEQLIQDEFRIEEELPERLLDLYIAACNDNPRWWYPAKNAGGLLYDQGKFNEAIYYLTRAYIYDEDPDGETAYYLGSCFMELGNTDEGFPLMVQALDLGVNETIESHISWYLHTLTAEGGNQNEETDS